MTSKSPELLTGLLWLQYNNLQHWAAVTQLRPTGSSHPLCSVAPRLSSTPHLSPATCLLNLPAPRVTFPALSCFCADQTRSKRLIRAPGHSELTQPRPFPSLSLSIWWNMLPGCHYMDAREDSGAVDLFGCGFGQQSVTALTRRLTRMLTLLFSKCCIFIWQRVGFDLFKQNWLRTIEKAGLDEIISVWRFWPMCIGTVIQ